MKSCSIKVLAAMLLTLAFWPYSIRAQININNNDPVEENFNGMAATTALPANWKISRVVTTTNTSAVTNSSVVPVASTANLLVGMLAVTSGSQIPAGTTIASIGTGNVTLSAVIPSIANGSTIAFTNGNSPDYASSINPTSVGNATTSGSAAGNSYNYGATTVDRAVGFQSSLTVPTPQALMVAYRNNTGTPITGVTMSFNIERYRINSTAASVSFFYSTDGVNWQSVPTGDVPATSFPTGSSTFTFATPTTVSRSASISSINIANGSDIYFRWGFNLANANSQGLAVDDVSLTVNVPECETPTTQPTALNLTGGTATTINGSFTAASGTPSGYLVVRYPQSATPTNPTNGVQYATGNSIGAGTVVSFSSGTTFSATGLNAASSYDLYIYSYNSAACSGGPKYNVSAPLTGFISGCGSLTAPTTLNFTSVGTGSLTGSISGISGNPAGYLVVIYPNGATPTPPTDGVLYTFSSPLGTGTIINTGLLTTFTAVGLTVNTNYDFYIYSIANTNCLGGPVYSSTPLFQTQSTAGCSAFAPVITINPTATPVDGSVFNSLTAAVNQLSGCSISQPTVIELAANYTSAGETFPINLPNISGASSTNTITIRPAFGASNLEIKGNVVGNTVLQINGGTNWILDGRPGGTGSTYGLTIENTDNTTAGAMGIRLINGAQNNLITYLDVRTANIGVSSGCIAFSTSSTVGNSNNTVSFCKVHEGTAGLPNVGISSVGSAGFANDNNQILNNQIYNVFAASGNTYGIYISDHTTNWNISGNSIYQTAARVQISNTDRNYCGIASSPSSAANVTGLNITGNFIGGTAPNCGGAAQSISDNGTASVVLRGIFLQVGTAVPTSVQGNTIANINITSTSASFNHSGISAITGSMNIGTITGNTIGSLTSNNSIILTQTTATSASRLSGITAGVGTPGTIVISNNNIGGLTVNNSSSGNVNLAGIFVTNAAYTINNNIIGGIANSLQNNTANDVWGINLTNATTGSTVSGNTVRNLTGSTGRAIGIRADGGANTISGNNKFNLSTTSTQADGACGIVSASTAAGQTIAGNTIHSVTNNSLSANTSANGIYYTGPTSGSNIIERNFVHSLNSLSIATTSNLFGIRVLAAALPVIIQNNMVRLGIQADGAAITSGIGIVGIFNGSTATNNTYFNSVYVGGTASGTTGYTFAMQSTASGNTRAIQNNIFVNLRSGGSGGSHYAYAVGGSSVNPTGLTQNHNIYRATGTNAFTALYNGSNVSGVTGLQAAIGQDGNSYFCDPAFISANGAANAVNLRIRTNVATIVEGKGVFIASVTNDIDGQTRSALTPTDIGADAGNFISTTGCGLTWTGAASTNWSDAANWDAGELPSTTTLATISGTPSNQPVLTANAVTGSLTITADALLTIPSSHTLSVHGNVSSVLAANVVGEGKISITGASAQTLTGTLNVSNIEMANSAGFNLATGARINLVPANNGSAVLSFLPNAVLNNPNGSIILKSNATGTASIGALPSSAQLNGKITVERKHPTTPGWYFTGAPIQNATINDWSEMTPVVMPKQNGNVFKYTEDDATVFNFDGRNIEENGWKVPDALTDLLNPGGRPSGYRVYLTSRFMGATGGVMSVNGFPYLHDVPVQLTKTPTGFAGGGWNLLVNPYASAIDWNATRFNATNASLNMGNSVLIWNGATQNYGAWTALTESSGTGVGIASPYIASSQAFFVRANENLTLTFKESFKSGIGASSMRSGALANELKFKLEQGNRWDEASVLFYPSASNEADRFDAENWSSSLDISSSNAQNQNLAINVMAELTRTVEIPVNIRGAIGEAKISFQGLSSFDENTTITLIDHFSGQRFNLTQHPVVTFSITAEPASQGFGRFTLVFSPTVTGIENSVAPKAQLNLWPNPATNLVNVNVSGLPEGEATAEIIDQLGRVVRSQTMPINEIGSGRIVLQDLTRGMYHIRVRTAGSSLTQQLVVK